MKIKLLLTTIITAGLFLPLFGQNHTIDGIDLKFAPNDGTHNRFSTKRWDPRIKIYKDMSFVRFFQTRTSGWNGGDGFYSTLLPDGNTFWSIADSFTGPIVGDRIRQGGAGWIRNGAIIQTGLEPEDFFLLNRFSTVPGREYRAIDWLRHPAGSNTQAQINQGDNDSNMMYWPGDATVYHDPVNNTDTLQVLWGAVNDKMTRSETALTEYVIDGTPDNPGPNGYLKQVNYVRYFRPFINTYGSGIWEDYAVDGGDGHTYYYGAFNNYPVVARSETHDIKSPWEYWLRIGTEWSWQRRDENGPTDDEMSRSRICDHWMSNANIIKHEGKYYFISQEPGGPEVYIWEGVNTPYGNVSESGTYTKIPQNRRILYLTEGITPRLKPNLNTASYNSFISPQYASEQGELFLSFNANPADFWDNFNVAGSADLYQPYFVRIFNWEKVFEPLPALNVKSITVKDICGEENCGGKISPNTPQTRNAGTGITFTITPDAGYEVAEFNVYSDAFQTNGVTKASISVANRWVLSGDYAYGDYTVEVVFKPMGNYICGETAIENIDNEDCIVYPNPTDGKVFVSNLNSPVAVSVYDNSGRLLQTVITEREIDLSAYPAGLYFLKVNNQLLKVNKK